MERQQTAWTESEHEDGFKRQATDSEERPQNDELYDDLYDVSDSEFIDNYRESQQATTPKVPDPAVPEVVTKPPNKTSASQKDAKARALAKKEEATQRRAAVHTAWLERLKSGSTGSNFTPEQLEVSLETALPLYVLTCGIGSCKLCGRSYSRPLFP